MLVLVIHLVAAATIPACASAPPRVTASPQRAVDGAGSSATAAGKPLPSATLAMRVVAGTATSSGAVVEVAVEPSAALTGVRLTYEAVGVVALRQRPIDVPPSLPQDATYRRTVEIGIAGLGRGTLAATLSATDVYGVTFRTTATLYVVADAWGVATGRQGFSQLERSRIEDLKTRGLLTDDAYRSRLRELLRGGASESGERLPQ